MFAWVEDDKVFIRCEYQEKEFVKAIGDYRFDKNSKFWYFPKRKLVDIIQNLQVTVSAETKEIYNELLKARQEHHAKINLANRIKAGLFYNKQDEDDFLFKTGLNRLPLETCMGHQRQAIELGVLFGSYAFFMETGTGKTLTAIRLMQHFRVPALVVTALPTIQNVWIREIDKWSKLKAVSLWNKLEKIKESYDVYIINYEQFKKLDGIPDLKKTLCSKIKVMIVDESSVLKNNKSQITKTIVSYNSLIEKRFCLTGTPAPNDLMEYWGQMAFINPEILFDNFYKFRNTYFTTTGYNDFIYVPKRGAKQEIIDAVSRQAFSVRKDDCLDLPEKTYQERYVVMDPAQEKLYDDMLKENILEFEGHTTIGANQLAKLMKLRQITSGFTITDESISVPISRSKIDTLLELIEEIPQDRQIIVWAQFHHEINLLLKELKDHGATGYYGLQSPKEKQDSLDAWMAGQKRILVGHPASGGMGLNLQQCSYMIWFSLSYSQEEYSQACDRIYRSGQKSKCTYYILIGQRAKVESKKDETVDQVIYDVLQKKADLMNSCMEMLKTGR